MEKLFVLFMAFVCTVQSLPIFQATSFQELNKKRHAIELGNTNLWDQKKMEKRDEKQYFLYKGTYIFKNESGYYFLNNTKVEGNLAIVSSTKSTSPLTTSGSADLPSSTETPNSQSMLAQNNAEGGSSPDAPPSASTAGNSIASSSPTAEEQAQELQILNLIQKAAFNSMQRKVFDIQNQDQFTDISQLRIIHK